jgi:hypothetical protein
MFRFWSKIIQRLFHKEQPKRVVVIGAPLEEGAVQLLSYCENMDSQLFIVDPLAVFQADEEMKRNHPYLHLIQDNSLTALPRIAIFDAVLIDGDHNWYTVYNELQYIERMAEKNGKFPLVFVHDIGWPYGRRDVYLNPETIPAEYRHPFAPKGIVYGQSKLADHGGFAQGSCHAVYENGIRNGVLTAVEDFLNEAKIPLSFHQLKSNNGLGIITEADRDNDTYIEMIIQQSGL